MTTKVGIYRKWSEPVPIGRDGQPVPAKLWPQRRRHTWVVRWFAFCADGRKVRQSKQFTTKQEAETFQAKQQAELDERPQIRRLPEKVTFGQFIEEFAALGQGSRGKRMKASSLNQARLVLDRFAKYVGHDRALAEIGPADAARYFSSMHAKAEKKVSVATVNLHKRTLKAAFNVAIRPLRYLRFNPFEGIGADRESKPKPRYVTAKEFAAMLAATDAIEPTDRALWWRTFLTVCYVSGLRWNEAVHLTWADIDFARETVSVRAKAESKTTLEWSPKSYESREIPIPAGATALLTRMQAASPDGYAYVFLPQSRFETVKAAKEAGTWKAHRHVLDNFHRDFGLILADAAADAPTLLDGEGKGSVTLHDLRRTCLTNWATNGVAARTLQELAGHKDIQTTMAYYQSVTDDQISRAREASRAAFEDADLKQSDPKVTPERTRTR